ncbi:hypothetical protein B0H10DRAFT_1940591 [Mycena sp. CBHHK59/15]|nr:hypothetical protein B0H10DRAFT_1940591 [Mycena sp. CBHHK59/15]
MEKLVKIQEHPPLRCSSRAPPARYYPPVNPRRVPLHRTKLAGTTARSELLNRRGRAHWVVPHGCARLAAGSFSAWDDGDVDSQRNFRAARAGLETPQEECARNVRMCALWNQWAHEGAGDGGVGLEVRVAFACFTLRGPHLWRMAVPSMRACHRWLAADGWTLAKVGAGERVQRRRRMGAYAVTVHARPALSPAIPKRGAEARIRARGTSAALAASSRFSSAATHHTTFLRGRVAGWASGDEGTSVHMWRGVAALLDNEGRAMSERTCKEGDQRIIWSAGEAASARTSPKPSALGKVVSRRSGSERGAGYLIFSGAAPGEDIDFVPLATTPVISRVALVPTPPRTRQLHMHAAYTAPVQMQREDAARHVPVAGFGRWCKHWGCRLCCVRGDTAASKWREVDAGPPSLDALNISRGGSGTGYGKWMCTCLGSHTPALPYPTVLLYAGAVFRKREARIRVCGACAAWAASSCSHSGGLGAVLCEKISNFSGTARGQNGDVEALQIKCEHRKETEGCSTYFRRARYAGYVKKSGGAARRQSQPVACSRLERKGLVAAACWPSAPVAGHQHLSQQAAKAMGPTTWGVPPLRGGSLICA